MSEKIKHSQPSQVPFKIAQPIKSNLDPISYINFKKANRQEYKRENQPIIIQKYLKFLNIDTTKFRNVVHIIGSSGKGLVAIILASLLYKQKYKVALITKPHLKTYRERFNYDGKLAKTKTIINILKEIQQIQKRYRLPYLNYTQRAFLAEIAYFYKYSKQIDYLIVEAGIGAKNDYTDIFRKNTNYFNIITTVNKDHIKTLGNSLKKIAQQKCSLIPYTKASFLLDTDVKKLTDLSFYKDKLIIDLSNNIKKIDTGLAGSIIYTTSNKVYTTNLFQPTYVNTLAKIINILPFINANTDNLPNTLHLYIPLRSQLNVIDNKAVIIDNAHSYVQYKTLGITLKKIKKVYPYIKSSLFFATKGQQRTINIKQLLNCDKVYNIRIPKQKKEDRIYTIDKSVDRVDINTLRQALKKGYLNIVSGSVFLAGEVAKIFDINTNPLSKAGLSKSLRQQKAFIRKLIKTRRGRLSLSYIQKNNVEILQKVFDVIAGLKIKNLMLYIPINNEPNLTQLLIQNRYKLNLWLPYYSQNKWSIANIKDAHTLFKLIKHKKVTYQNIPERFAVQTVNSVKDIPFTKLVLLPGLAFDHYGNRIGFGSGTYDNYINECNIIWLDLLKKAKTEYDSQIKQAIKNRTVVLPIYYSFQKFPYIADYKKKSYNISYIL